MKNAFDTSAPQFVSPAEEKKYLGGEEKKYSADTESFSPQSIRAIHEVENMFSLKEHIPLIAGGIVLFFGLMFMISNFQGNSSSIKGSITSDVSSTEVPRSSSPEILRTPDTVSSAAIVRKPLVTTKEVARVETSVPTVNVSADGVVSTQGITSQPDTVKSVEVVNNNIKDYPLVGTTSVASNTVSADIQNKEEVLTQDSTETKNTDPVLVPKSTPVPQAPFANRMPVKQRGFGVPSPKKI